MQVTIGGDRLGAGKKMKQRLNNYYRSTHDLSQTFASSAGPGMLIPFLVLPALRGDKFKIDLSAGLRTIPTKGPLFGSFKFQLDVFKCPIRLYQAILHNNPTDVGLKMSQIKLPKMRLYRGAENVETPCDCASNSLIKYLGLSSVGHFEPILGADPDEFYRDFNAVPLLAYYDIFKNYYANLQEENAYTTKATKIEIGNARVIDYGFDNLETEKTLETDTYITYNANPIETAAACEIFIVTLEDIENNIPSINDSVVYDDGEGHTITKFLSTFNEGIEIISTTREGLHLYQTAIKIPSTITDQGDTFTLNKITLYKQVKLYGDSIELQPFKIKNIDDMRYDILSFHRFGQSFLIDGWADASTYPIKIELPEPYISAVGTQFRPAYKEHLAGLVVKTYQNDIFNNWINTEWLDGENGIAAITAIAVTDGKINVDALNFSEKLYNLLNRVALAGPTYEDWLDATYEQTPKRHLETPMWCGGMSNEIVFDEIVQTAPTEGDPLGSLGGRGKLISPTGKKDGKMTIKIDEPCFIIGIMSITPRIYQTQGNEFYMTELDSIDDLHKPGLDQIGFQNLLDERMLGSCASISGGSQPAVRHIVGKLPAWMEYMTAVDKAYGDFAEPDGKGYMILQRQYEYDNESGTIKDATTYIDPIKYNYAFAYTERDSQNFWVQIHSKIIARRLMSAKQIPNI